jgi:uncharacterized protein involved in exopolysaccharide biosynthesis
MSFEDARQWQAERLRLLWGRRGFFLRAAGIGLIVSTLIAFLMPNYYTSTTQLMPPDEQSTAGLAMMGAMMSRAQGGSLSTVVGNLLGLKTTGALFITILRSQTAQENLIQKFDLRKVYGIRRVSDARLKLDDRTSVSEDHKSGVITVEVTDRSAQRAAALAGAYVDQLNSLIVELSTSSAHRERVFLEGRLNEVKQDLEAAEKEFSQFSSKNTAINISEQAKAMVQAAAILQGQLIAAQSELTGLQQIYSDSNVRVRVAEAGVKELEKKLNEIGAAGTEGESQNDNSLFPSIRKLPLLGVAYADLYRRTKVDEAIFEALTQQYELAKVEEAKTIPSVKVLDVAKVPEKKSFPPRLVIMFLGSFLAVAISVSWVLASARWDEVEPHDPRKIFFKEIAETWKTQLPWTTQTGNGTRSRAQQIWDRFTRGQPPSRPTD